MELLSVFLFVLYMNKVFCDETDEQMELSNDLVKKPLSHYKFKLKTKFKEKVVPTMMLLTTKETQIIKPPLYQNSTKILPKKPKLRLKPTGIRNTVTKINLQINKHIETGTIQSEVKRFKDTLLNDTIFDEDIEFNDSVIFDELRKSLTSQNDDRSLYETIIQQNHWMVLATTERPNSTSPTDINFGLDFNEAWNNNDTTRETTFRTTTKGKTSRKGEPSMLEEMDVDAYEKGPRPTPMIKNETREMVELFHKLIKAKNPLITTAIRNELMDISRRKNEHDASKNKPIASIFDETFAMPDPENTAAPPYKRRKLNKKLHNILKVLIERKIVNKTWLLSELEISTEPAIKTKSKVSRVQHFKRKTLIIDNNSNESSTEYITRIDNEEENDKFSIRLYIKEKNRNKVLKKTTKTSIDDTQESSIEEEEPAEFSRLQPNNIVSENEIKKSNGGEVMYSKTTAPMITEKKSDALPTKIYAKDNKRTKIFSLFPTRPIKTTIKYQLETVTRSTDGSDIGIINFTKSNLNEEKEKSTKTNVKKKQRLLIYSIKKSTTSATDLIQTIPEVNASSELRTHKTSSIISEKYAEVEDHVLSRTQPTIISKNKFNIHEIESKHTLKTSTAVNEEQIHRKSTNMNSQEVTSDSILKSKGNVEENVLEDTNFTTPVTLMNTIESEENSNIENDYNDLKLPEIVYPAEIIPIKSTYLYHTNLTKIKKQYGKNNRPSVPVVPNMGNNYLRKLEKLTNGPLDITLPRSKMLTAKTLKDIEKLYKSNDKMVPNRTCGIDNSPVNTIYEGHAKIETYPWLGVLFYRLDNKRLTTSVVLVTKQIVIGSAMDVHKLPKIDFRSKLNVNSNLSTDELLVPKCSSKKNQQETQEQLFLTERARVVLGRSCDQQWLHVLDYNYHPEYRSDSYSSLVIVQLDLDSAQHELRPICAPPAILTETIFHAMVLPQDCNSNKIKIYEMIHVPTAECKYFYRRSGLDIQTIWPKHTACGRARWGGECVWHNGAALVVKQNGRWHLLGFGVHGPGCQAPARFIDYGMYRRWVADSVARIGRPAITRLGPNHLVLRRTTYKIQRFGICDKGEVLEELFTDETRIETGLKDLGRARYNVTIFANSEYACVIFKASYDPEMGIAAKPRVFLRRYCPASGPMCFSATLLRVDFYVEIVYTHPLTFKVLAYGKEAKIIDHKMLMKYANAKRNSDCEIPQEDEE